MKTIQILGVVSVLLFASHARAGTEEVAACAETLSDPAQLIFQEVAPKLTPGADAPSVMRSSVMSLVRSGAIKRSEARASAEAAAECFMKYSE